MSIFLRDPLMRELLLADYNERERQLRPYHYHHIRQPVRVQRLDWPLTSTFDQALDELQTVMSTVNDAIGQYQNSVMKDLGSGGMNMNTTDEGHLQVGMDVSQFKPEEVQVYLSDDNSHLCVAAKTESKENDSYHKCEFKRCVRLPADTKLDAIKSTLTPDRKLLIEVPRNKPALEEKRQRNIPIDIQRPPVEDTACKKPVAGDQNNKQAAEQATNGKK